MMNNFRRCMAFTAAAVGLAGLSLPGWAQYREDVGPVGPAVPVRNPQITDKTNSPIPLDLPFMRSDGTPIKLGDLFNQKKPVILSLVYFSCPNLCGLTQDSLAAAVRVGPRDLVLGKDFDVVVVSIDPDDTPAGAAQKRAHYLALMGRPDTQTGFTYLTGTQDNIEKLADAVGYGYRQNFGLKDGDPSGKFAHSAGIFVCTPYGRLSKTIAGISYPSDDLHYALLQAADGKIGSSFLEEVELPCGAVRLGAHGYEVNPWFWAGAAGGGASLLFMAIFMGMMWHGEWKKKHNGGGPPPDAPGDLK